VSSCPPKHCRTLKNYPLLHHEMHTSAYEQSINYLRNSLLYLYKHSLVFPVPSPVRLGHLGWGKASLASTTGSVLIVLNTSFCFVIESSSPTATGAATWHHHAAVISIQRCPAKSLQCWRNNGLADTDGRCPPRCVGRRKS